MRRLNKGFCLMLAVLFALDFATPGFCDLAEDYFNRATQYYLKGNLDQAKAQLETACQVNPEYQPAKKLLNALKEQTGLGLKGETLLSLDFKDAEITTILQALSQSYGLNIIAGEDVKGKVTVSFRDVTLEQALDSLLKVNGFAYERVNNVIIVRSAKGGKSTVILPLKYVSADTAKDMLAKVISSDGSLEIHKEANALVVTDVANNIAQIKGLLGEMDAPPVQISIEAKLVDIQSKDLRAIGVKYNVEYKDTDIFGHRGSTNTTAEEVDSSFDLATESSTLSGGQFILNTFTIKHWVADATIDALVSKQKAHLLASPSITVLNNHEAKIIIGEKVPYREETQTPVGTTETTRFIDVGTSLSVTPRANDDDYVTMTIHPEVSSVSELLDDGPRITTREADTTVRVRDGETVVIGGLIKNENNGIRSRIPILGSLPVIGFLFSNRNEDKIQTELAVFITPHIIRSDRKSKLQAKFAPVNAEVLFERAESLMNNLGVETWDKTREEVLIDVVATLEQLAVEYPSSDKADDALYNIGMIYYKDRPLKNWGKAKENFLLLVNHYPDSKYVERAANIIKKIESREKRKKPAKR